MSKDNSAPLTLDDAINSADTASSLVNKYIVSPVANLGLAGFVFDIAAETKVDLSADITDHYTENNSAIQDHIALKPDKIFLRGYIGELVNTVTKPKSSTTKLTEKLVTVSAYLPLITNSAKQLQSAISSAKGGGMEGYLDAATSSGVDLYNTYKKLNPPKTKQAKAFNFFKALFGSRQLVALETPYTFYNNMAIESISATQPEETDSFTEFSITLKKVRVATTKFVRFDPNKFQGRAAAQNADEQNKGRAVGKDTKRPGFFTGLFSLF